MERYWLYLAMGSLLLSICSSHLDEELRIALRTTNNKSVQQYCGSMLTTKLSLVCNGNYNSLSRIMKTYQKRDSNMKSYQKTEELQFPLRTREEANAFIRYKRRRRRGITDECCHKACSLAEMKTFCDERVAPPPHSRQN